MADPWEQILHHTFSGTPGVIADLSPARRYPGVPQQITLNQYLRDGTAPGSGVIDFRGGGVVTARLPGVNPLRGLRVEVTVAGEAHADGYLVAGDGFSLTVGSGYLNLYLRGTGPVPSDLLHVAPFRPSPDRWNTVGFLHDGVSTVFMTIDGSVVNEIDGVGLSALRAVSIGNSAAMAHPFGGLIDDVAIWRANPHRINDEFFGRPMDEATRQCWLEWVARVRDFAQTDPDCVSRVLDLVRAAVDDMLARGSAHGAEVRRQWQDVSREYRDLWSNGRLDDVAELLVERYRALAEQGLDPMESPTFVALRDDPCFAQMVESIGAATCDPDFTGEINGVISGIDAIRNPTGPT
ncbi:LamG domain-containing protein [Gordonia polyisoprenivorans]|uniref:LamG domain-containing protein n=1 Tax=Gordonia polyisoprenivorans TaxID=84595 RepID=UPI0020138DB9|nr:LamG domain-containing protein [Gordonia polyisoprenivorans]